jgi:hypothetical protein
MYFYYNKNKKTWQNRFDALQDPSVAVFYFHEKELRKTNWKIEPLESLQELYHQRAQWIRDNYEYVILAYSGGIDSTNVLESFYYNGIHIDEIVSVGALSQDKTWGSDENHNGDLYYNVFPTLDKLNLPATKISIVDYTREFDTIDNLTALQKFGTDYHKELGTHISPHNLWWYDLKKFIGANNDKKTAVVFGFEKPWFRYTGAGQTYLQFKDTFFQSYGANFTDQNFHRVNFYSDENTGTLMCKQGHVIKNWFYKNNMHKANNYQFFYKNHDKIIEKLIYPNMKHPLEFHSKKTPQNVLSYRDTYLKTLKNEPLYQIHTSALKKHFQLYPFDAPKKNNEASIAYLTSLPYYLE